MEPDDSLLAITGREQRNLKRLPVHFYLFSWFKYGGRDADVGTYRDYGVGGRAGDLPW